MKYLFLLYKKMYNEKHTFMYERNICCRYTFFYDLAMIIAKSFVSYNTIYTFVYDRNICCYYILSYIMIRNILLYIVSYNKMFLIIIRDDVYWQ